jgi:hypothetical protein
LEFIGFAMPISKYGVFGINTILMLYESIPITLESEETLGNINWLDWALTFSWGKMVSDDLSAGTGIKVIQKRESDPIFGNTTGTAYALDLGLIYEYPYLDKLTMGISLLNLGGKIHMEGEQRKDDLPATLKLGLAYNKYPFLFTFDLNKIIREDWSGRLGLEYDLGENLFLRAGYFRKAGNINGITYGIGGQIENIEFGWANIPSGELVGYTRQNRVSMIIRF